MALVRPLTRAQNMERLVNDGDLIDVREVESTLTTAGSGAILASMMATSVLRRSGPAGGFTDTFDSAQNIVNALTDNANAAGPGTPGFLPVTPTVSFGPLYVQANQPQPGANYRWLYLNTVAQAMTAAVTTNTGVTLGSNVNVAASLWREYRISLLNTSLQQTDASVTFNNANGNITGVDSTIIQQLTPGMTIASAGNVTAGTTILSISVATNTVVASANGLANATAAVTFMPTVLIAGLRSGTA